MNGTKNEVRNSKRSDFFASSFLFYCLLAQRLGRYLLRSFRANGTGLVVVVVVVYFILSRLLYLAFSANLVLLFMPHPGMGPLV